METNTNHILSSYPSSSLSNYGLLITLDSDSEDSNEGKTCHLRFCPDVSFRELHPNIRGPEFLSQVTKLGGGGSGVTVFSGHLDISYRNMSLKECPLDDEYNYDLVMKHGGYKDTQELWALAHISQELHRVRKYHSHYDDESESNGHIKHDHPVYSKDRETKRESARKDFEKRIPQFRMIYISPYHLRRPDLWDAIRHHLFPFVSAYSTLNRSEHSGLSTETDSCGCTTCRTIHLHKSSKPDTEILIDSHSIDLYFPSDDLKPLHTSESLSMKNQDKNWKQTHDNQLCFQYGEKGRGYETLQILLNQCILPLQKSYGWKFTLGQSVIGGETDNSNPLQIASVLLTQGKLKGDILHTLITKMVQVVHDLQSLTLPHEKDVLNELHDELEELQKNENDSNYAVDIISPTMNSFVGACIRKNWHCKHGRFPRLYQWGIQLRLAVSSDSSAPSSLSSSEASFLTEFSSNQFVLTPDEYTPAFHLGSLLSADISLDQVFVDIQIDENRSRSCIIHSLLQSTTSPSSLFSSSASSISPWKEILQYSLHNVKSPNAIQRIWTGGLTDAGLHNLFLNSEELCFFDLGTPSIESLPGFLTKFLFSFFHAMGMEEDGKGSWVNRFDIVPVESLSDNGNSNFDERLKEFGRLKLTNETKTLLGKACEAFEKTLDEFISQLFDGEDAVRWLLLKYMTLQLVSDASFCFEKWKIKGGGRSRVNNHQKCIVKWLWRALWDLYVASFINTEESLRRFKVVDLKCA